MYASTYRKVSEARLSNRKHNGETYKNTEFNI